MTALWGGSSLLALQSGGRGACLCGRQFSRAAGLDTALRNYVAGDSNPPPQPPDLRSCCLPCGRAAAGCGRTFLAAATPASQPRRASAAASAARSCEPAGWQMGVQLPSRLSVAHSKGSEGAGQHLAARVQSSYQENLCSLSCFASCFASGLSFRSLPAGSGFPPGRFWHLTPTLTCLACLHCAQPMWWLAGAQSATLSVSARCGQPLAAVSGSRQQS